MNGIQFASVSGSYSTSFIGSWELLSQSIAGNYSVIRLYSTFRYGGGTSVGSSSSTFQVNGVTVKTGSYRYYPGDTQLGYTDITVYHNADGTFPAQTVSIYADSYHIGNKSASGTIAGVATIPRASSVGISSSQITMGDTLSLYVGRASDSFYHTLTYNFGGASGTIATGVGTGASWTVPIDLAYQIPNSVSGVGTIYCYTYSGGAHIGTSSINFTAVVPQSIAPNFQSLTLERIDNTVPKSWGIYVKTKSSCTATINGATGSYGSTISSYAISGGGYSSSANTLTTGILNIVGTVTFTARITDSRGRTATKQESITVVDYSGPNIAQVLTQRCKKDGTLDNDGTYAKCKATISYSDCNSKNALTQKVYFKKSGTEQWSTGTQFTNEVIIGGGNISIDYSYDVKYEVSDTFTTVVFIDFISTAFTTVDYKKGGKGIAFGKVSEKDCFECAMDTEFTSSVKKNNNPLHDFEIGDLYFTTNPKSPAERFGGTWEAWGKGRIPLGCGYNDANTDTQFGNLSAGVFNYSNPGVKGGEYSHTLHWNEMPQHAHNFVYGGREYSGWQYSKVGGQSINFYCGSGEGSTFTYIGNAGASYAHNNIQPYESCYMWKRVG